MAEEIPVTPELLLQAYCTGYFPMARSQRGRTLYWFNPDTRAILPLEQQPSAFHIPRSLAKFLRKCPYRISTSEAFEQVIRACADNRRPNREDTWINKQIIDLYTQLHHLGYAHSVEAWEGQTLVGGVYGVSIGGAFFGESMFSTRTNASKVALVHLVRRLEQAGYTLLDAQFENDHLTQFGFHPIAQQDYLLRLRHALSISPNPSSRFRTISVSNP
jgi:leucyl/phenylalanyl-tRNA---protein transferase